MSVGQEGCPVCDPSAEEAETEFPRASSYWAFPLYYTHRFSERWVQAGDPLAIYRKVESSLSHPTSASGLYPREIASEIPGDSRSAFLLAVWLLPMVDRLSLMLARLVSQFPASTLCEWVLEGASSTHLGWGVGVGSRMPRPVVP